MDISSQIHKKAIIIYYTYGRTTVPVFIPRLHHKTDIQLNSEAKFSQGQLCVIVRLPENEDRQRHPDETPEDFRNRKKLKVKLVPPGERRIVIENVPDAWPAIYFDVR